jgi:serine-type D-Ala-D-Ala carboxypeptidase
VDELESVAQIAQVVLDAGTAPQAAAGFAIAGRRGWEVSVGGSAGVFFDLASLTKPMTALAFTRSGVDRTTPLGALLEEARNTPSEHVPVELLLAHRAGLEAHLPLFKMPAADRLRAAASARRADVEVLGQAGAPPLYSDLGYALAGEALARHLRARDAAEVIADLVVEPLGLWDALGAARELRARGVGFDERVAPTEVVDWRGGEVRGAVHDENAWAMTGAGGSGHAGMFGTASGVLRFGAAVLDDLAARPEVGWLVAPRAGGDLRAGFDGKSVEGSSAGAFAGPRTFGHLGFTGTSLWIDPDAAAVTVLLTNRVHPTRDDPSRQKAIRSMRPLAHDALFRLALAKLASAGAPP